MSVLEDGKYLSYRPDFDIRRALRFRVEKEGATIEAEPELPTELVAASSILASELLARCDALLDKTKALMQQLADCVESSFPGEISAYEEAVKNDDRHAVALFEDKHCVDIAGNTQAELYAVCKNIEQAVARMHPYIIDCVSPIKPAEGIRLQEAEERYYSDLAYLEYNQPGTINRLALAYEAQLKYQANTRLEYFGKIVEEVETTARAGYAELCNNNPVAVADEIVAAGPQKQDALLAILKTSYNILAGKGISLNNHSRVFDFENTMEPLRASLSSLTELRLKDSLDVVGWLQQVDAEDGDSPIYHLANQLLIGLEAIDSSLDTTILDLAKSQEAEYLHLKDRVENIYQRKQVRQLLTLIGRIKEAVSTVTTPEEAQQRAAAIAADFAACTGLCV